MALLHNPYTSKNKTVSEELLQVGFDVPKPRRETLPITRIVILRLRKRVILHLQEGLQCAPAVRAVATGWEAGSEGDSALYQINIQRRCPDSKKANGDLMIIRYGVKHT